MASDDVNISRLLKLAHKFNCFYLSGKCCKRVRIAFCSYKIYAPTRNDILAKIVHIDFFFLYTQPPVTNLLSIALCVHLCVSVCGGGRALFTLLT